jgi:outer membrane receptor protein involved in Fe transport
MVHFSKKIAIVISFIFTTINLSSQPKNYERPNGAIGRGSVKGIVVDDVTLSPVGYASVALYQKADSTLVNGMITDDKGNFILDGIKPGLYFIKIKFVGYKTYKSKAFQLLKENPVFNLDTIKISSTTQTLKEVTITAEKNMVQAGLEKKVFNASQNIAASGGTALDLMQNIPAVSVDIDGNVSLRGSTSVTILVDGKPSMLTSLDQMPASMIENVEVITNPSAKYDPDGTAGIINIILKKDKAQGYNGQFSFTAGTKDKYMGSAALNYRINKFNIFTNYNVRYYSQNGSGSGSTMRDSLKTGALSPDTLYTIKSTQTSHRTGITNSIKLGTDYYLNKKNTLSLSGLYNINKRPNLEEIKYNSNNYVTATNTVHDRTTNEIDKNNGTDLALDYKKTFEHKGQELTAGVYYTFSNGTEFLDTRDQYTLPLDSTSLQKYNSETKNNILTLQSDYVEPFSEKGKLEAGYKSIINQTTMDFNTTDYNASSGSYELDPLSVDHFTYKQQIHSVYGILTNTINKTEYQLGLRVEKSMVTTHDQSTDTIYKQNLFELFPSAHLEQKINENNTIMLSYSRRINRPSIRQLNPFIDRSDNQNLRSGNPYLKPEFINSLELGHLLLWGKNNSLNSSVFYKQSNNMINRYNTIDSVNITHTKFVNIGKATSYGFEFIFQQDFASWWKFNTNTSFYKNIISRTTDLGNIKTTSNLSYTVKATTNFILSKTLFIQFMGNYMAPQVTTQGTMRGMRFVDMGIRKDVLKGKGTFNFRVSDIFNTMRFKINIEGDNNNYFSSMIRKRDSRVFFLGFTYRINNFKADKKKKAEEENQNNNSEMME